MDSVYDMELSWSHVCQTAQGIYGMAIMKEM